MKCFICRNKNLFCYDYLRLNSISLKRNLAYFIPEKIASIICYLNSNFSRTYNPVRINKKYFNKKIIFCPICMSGQIWPPLSDGELSDYYNDFYWGNRDQIDGEHIPCGVKPNINQLTLNINRIEWINKYIDNYISVIDFGAGDCAASKLLINSPYNKRVTVVDPSTRAFELASLYGANFCYNLDSSPLVDLIYSSHSIEHVHDLMLTLKVMKNKLNSNGYIFIETPNIYDEAVISGLVHTPHTFMLSSKSFYKIANLLNLEIIAMECVGPLWSESFKKIKSLGKQNLRVILHKNDSLNRIGTV